MAKTRGKNGFTLVELLIVVIVIGILAAVALPNLIGAREKANLAGVKDNMHTVQVAAEGYHTETQAYAGDASALDPFFPSGGFTIGGANGTRPINPCTGASGELPYQETFATSAAILAARQTAPAAGAGGPGQVGYCPSDGTESYAICGLNLQKVRLANPHAGTLVLSNQ